MECPHCETAVAWTWARYARAPLGRLKCVTCGGRYRIKHSGRYYVALVGVWLVFGVLPLGAVLWFGGTWLQGIGVFVVMGLVVILPVDKWLEGQEETVKAE